MNEEDKYRSEQHSTGMDNKNGNKAEKVVRTLIEEIDSIRYVKQWAKEANVSRSWLKKKMKTTYDKPPKIILREVRFEVITFLIMGKGVEASSLCVANESGVGKTSDALYKFLSRHYETTFTRLKEKVLTGEHKVDFVWLEWKDRFYFYKYRNGR
jgi:hypothetical protein